MKFVERGGTTIRSLLIKSDPFQPTHCGREQCWHCNGPMSIPSDKPTPSGRPSVEEQSQRSEEGDSGDSGEQRGKTMGRPGIRRYNHISSQ